MKRGRALKRGALAGALLPVKSYFYGGCGLAAGPFVGQRLWKIEAHGRERVLSMLRPRSCARPDRGFPMQPKTERGERS